MPRLSVLSVLSALLLVSPLAAAFNFEFQPATLPSCGRVNVVWRGGTPPFRLMVIPAFDYPQNISIPSSAWDSTTQIGSYAWTVNYPAGTRLVGMMSDATAEGSGGVSPLFNVRSSDSTCNLRSTSTEFFFYLNSTNVNQCAPLEVYWDPSAVAPVTILGVIPQGQPFSFSASSGTRIRWNPNIAQGTSFILAAFDRGSSGIGGSSDLLTVGSGPAGCLDSSSPATTPAGQVITTGTPTSATSGQGGGVRTVTAIATVLPSGSGSGLGTGAIAGIAVGAVLVVLVVQGLIFWFCCRRQLAALLSHRRDMRKRGVKHGEVDLAASAHDPNEAVDLSRRDSARSHAHAHTHTHTHAYGSRGRTRPSTDGGLTEAESSISPFRDPSTVGRTGLPLLPSPNSDPFWTANGRSSDHLEPPSFAPGHVRTDSSESGTTFEMPSRRHSQQGLLESPSSPAGGGFGSGYDSGYPVAPSAGPSASRSNKAALVAQFEREERDRQRERDRERARGQMYSQPSFATRDANAGVGVGARSGTTPSPSLSTLPLPPSDSQASTSPRMGLGYGSTASQSNLYSQAHAHARAPRDDDFGAALPPLAAPRGGFTRHEDAGPLQQAEADGDEGDEDDVVDLPPLYRPEWETESARSRARDSPSMGSFREQRDRG